MHRKNLDSIELKVCYCVSALAEGRSSIFPTLMITPLMITPLMIAGYQKGKLDTTSKQFKILTGFAYLIGLTVPIFGTNPIKVQNFNTGI